MKLTLIFALVLLQCVVGGKRVKLPKPSAYTSISSDSISMSSDEQQTVTEEPGIVIVPITELNHSNKKDETKANSKGKGDGKPTATSVKKNDNTGSNSAINAPSPASTHSKYSLDGNGNSPWNGKPKEQDDTANDI